MTATRRTRSRARPLLLTAALGLAGCSTSAARAPAAPAPGTAGAGATQGGYVTTGDGVRLYYQRVGRGPQVVVVPARLFLAADFARLQTPERTLVFYDMRNRGRSDPVRDTTTLTVQQDVADLERLRQELGIERMSLVGFSYLGLMVVMYAADHPGRVDRIVQIGPVPRKFGTEYPAHLTANDQAPVLDSAEVERARRLRDEGYDAEHPREYCEIEWSIYRYSLVGDRANVDKLGPGPCDMPNEHPVNLRRHFRFNFVSVQRLDFPIEAVRRVTVPVLTIHGTKDRNAPYGGGREWASTLPDARLLTVPGAAHLPWVEAPELVFPAIDLFLRGQWPPRAERPDGDA
jgi:proline iminopeptidase